MLARSCGMKTLREDGLDKILQGMTTLDEILRVVPKEMDSGVSCDSCGQSLISAFQFFPYCGARRPEGSPDVHRQAGEYAGELLQ
jgi:hypothetical protein